MLQCLLITNVPSALHEGNVSTPFHAFAYQSLLLCSLLQDTSGNRRRQRPVCSCPLLQEKKSDRAGGVVITLYTCILELLGSNLGRTPAILTIFSWHFEDPQKCQDCASIRPRPFPSESSLIDSFKHPNTPCYVARVTASYRKPWRKHTVVVLLGVRFELLRIRSLNEDYLSVLWC